MKHAPSSAEASIGCEDVRVCACMPKALQLHEPWPHCSCCLKASCGIQVSTSCSVLDVQDVQGHAAGRLAVARQTDRPNAALQHGQQPSHPDRCTAAADDTAVARAHILVASGCRWATPLLLNDLNATPSWPELGSAFSPTLTSPRTGFWLICSENPVQQTGTSVCCSDTSCAHELQSNLADASDAQTAMDCFQQLYGSCCSGCLGLSLCKWARVRGCCRVMTLSESCCLLQVYAGSVYARESSSLLLALALA